MRLPRADLRVVGVFELDYSRGGIRCAPPCAAAPDGTNARAAPSAAENCFMGGPNDALRYLTPGSQDTPLPSSAPASRQRDLGFRPSTPGQPAWSAPRLPGRLVVDLRTLATHTFRCADGEPSPPSPTARASVWMIPPDPAFPSALTVPIEKHAACRRRELSGLCRPPRTALEAVCAFFSTRAWWRSCRRLPSTTLPCADPFWIRFCSHS